MTEHSYDKRVISSTEYIRRKIPWFKRPIERRVLTFDSKYKLKTGVGTEGWNFIGHNNKNLKQAVSGCAPVILNIERETFKYGKNEKAHDSHFKSTIYQRRERIDFILSNLMQYPLLVFPYFEKFIPPKEFDRAFELLNQKVDSSTFSARSKSSDSISYSARDFPSSPEEKSLLQPSSSSISSLTESDNLKEDNLKTYDSETNQILSDWMKEKMGKTKKHEEKFSISRDEEVRRQTRAFCDWIDKCGGNPENRLDYETIVNLFASSFESKPTLSVPIKIVERQDIPLDLKSTARTDSLKESTSPRSTVKSYKNLEKISGRTKDEITKRRLNYGAWYLPIEKWNRSKNNEKTEKLIDRRSSCRQEYLDETLSTLYATSVFSKFAKERGKPIPKILKQAHALKKIADNVK